MNAICECAGHPRLFQLLEEDRIPACQDAPLFLCRYRAKRFDSAFVEIYLVYSFYINKCVALSYVAMY